MKKNFKKLSQLTLTVALVLGTSFAVYRATTNTEFLLCLIKIKGL